VAYAVDSRGERIKQYYILPTSDPDDAVAALWQLLEREDPIVKLTLVKNSPDAGAPRAPSASSYEDDRAYCRRIAERGAAKIRRFR
jgi:hypothetical protein